MTDVKNHFPHLPAYQPPRTGWISYLPPSCVPYVQLMRMDRPGGLTYFLLPHLYGTVHAAIISRAQPAHLIRTSLLLFVGTVFMRGATCTWNDLVDAPFDRQVERTRHRAIARGAVSIPQALAFITVQSAAAGACLLPLPRGTAVCTLPAILGWFAYPLMKRVMDFPQAFLGYPMAWGVLVGASAMRVTSLPELASTVQNLHAADAAQLSICALFAANAAWTLCYETMYSYQDVRYDEKAGVRSLALLVRDPKAAKAMLAGMALVTVGLLHTAGQSLGLGVHSRYFAGSVLGTSLALALKIWRVNLQEPASCWWWFARGGLITGSCIMSGILGEYLRKI